MSDHDAFLRAIRAQPDDDTPRLAFADWLDEHDQPERAEFVRVQIELAPIRNHLESTRVIELRAREKALLAEHRAEWLGAAADIETEPPAFGPVFRRGFPERVCLSEDAFIARGEEFFAEHPTLYDVALFGLADTRRPLRRIPESVRVHGCEVVDFVRPYDMLESLGTLAERLGVRYARYWLAPNEHFHDTRYRIAGRWPRLGLLDIVQSVPSTAPVPEMLARWLGDRLGSTVPRVVTPFARRFPIAGGNPEDVCTGWKDGRPVLARQLLAGHSGGRQVLVGVKLLNGSPSDPMDRAVLNAAIFADDGNMTGEATYPVQAWRAGIRKGSDSPLGVVIAAKLREELDFEPGLIRVHEFASVEGMSLRLWPQHMRSDFFADPFHRPAHRSEANWRDRGGILWLWLHLGRFVVAWDGREFVFDDAGELI